MTTIEYLETLIVKAESEADIMEARIASAGTDAPSVRERVTFHRGQVSGLRHALFALRHGEEYL